MLNNKHFFQEVKRRQEIRKQSERTESSSDDIRVRPSRQPLGNRTRRNDSRKAPKKKQIKRMF